MFDSNLAVSLVGLCALALSACAQPGATTRAPEAVVASGVVNGQHLSLESSPSSSTAALLPAGARYRLVADAEQLALVIVGPDQRIAGRLRVRSLDGPAPASLITIDDFDGPATTIEVHARPGSLDGEARIGHRRARWRVRLDADGSLAGERWSPRQDARSTELRRARALGADLTRIAAALRRSGSLEPTARRDLGEMIALTELALELSLRAWEGHDRANLPKIGLDPLSPL